MTKKEEAIKFFEETYKVIWREHEGLIQLYDKAFLKNHSFTLEMLRVDTNCKPYIYSFEPMDFPMDMLEDLDSILHLYYLGDRRLIMDRDDLLNDGTSKFFDKINTTEEIAITLPDNFGTNIEDYTEEEYNRQIWGSVYANINVYVLWHWQNELGKSGVNSKKQVRMEMQEVLREFQKKLLKELENNQYEKTN